MLAVFLCTLSANAHNVTAFFDIIQIYYSLQMKFPILSRCFEYDGVPRFTVAGRLLENRVLLVFLLQLLGRLVTLFVDLLPDLEPHEVDCIVAVSSAVA